MSRRSDDPRPRDLLLDCARLARDHRIAVAWTAGVSGDEAKACYRGWKHAQPLPAGDDRALSSYATRCRSHNACVVAGASGLILVEADGGTIGILCAELGLPSLPPTLGAISKRGSHCYFKPPAKWGGARKFELSAAGVQVANDGYLVFAGGLHATGHVYQPLNALGGIAAMPVMFLEAAVELGRKTREAIVDVGWSDSGDDQPIPRGHRSTAVFTIALQAVRAGLSFEIVARELVALNRARCVPPLDDAYVIRQVEGAVRYANGHDLERVAAERVLQQALAERERAVTLEVESDRTDPDAASPPAGTHRGSLAAAAALLEAELADGDWHDSGPLKARVMEATKASRATLKRAARELAVEHRHRGFPASTWWRLPQLAQRSAQSAQQLAQQSAQQLAQSHHPRIEPTGDSA